MIGFFTSLNKDIIIIIIYFSKVHGSIYAYKTKESAAKKLLLWRYTL
jgi:hypothetical protein